MFRPALVSVANLHMDVAEFEPFERSLGSHTQLGDDFDRVNLFHKWA
jgi:hypothetical protein